MMITAESLHEGWTKCEVGDLGRLIRGISYVKEQASKSPVPEYLPILRANNINTKLSFEDLVYVPSSLVEEEQKIRRGDIIFAMSSGSLNLVGKSAPAHSDFDGSCGAFCAILRLEHHVSPEFFSYLFQGNAFRRKISEIAKGSNINNLKREHILDHQLALPPYPEQRRIVAKIEELFSELDKGIENLKHARAQLAVYRQALLKHAFEGKLTADWRAENANNLEPAEQLVGRIRSDQESRYERDLKKWQREIEKWASFDKKGVRPTKPEKPRAIRPLTADERAVLAPIPAEWCWARVEGLGAVQLGRQRSPANISKDYPTKYIRAANITEDGLALDDVKEMEFEPQEFETFKLRAGDLVLSEASGSASQVGKPAVWNDEIPNCCFQNTVIRHRPFVGSISPYLLTLYKFCYGSGQFAKLAGGVGINHLSAGKFSAMPIPVAPLREQERIVKEVERTLSVICVLESDIDLNLQKAEALRQAILKKAFAGELVPQDPNDEPASELLARIRAEHEAAAKSVANKKPDRRERINHRSHR
jgi:type I restriction enzyme, S subunit